MGKSRGDPEGGEQCKEGAKEAGFGREGPDREIDLNGRNSNEGKTANLLSLRIS